MSQRVGYSQLEDYQQVSAQLGFQQHGPPLGAGGFQQQGPPTQGGYQQRATSQGGYEQQQGPPHGGYQQSGVPPQGGYQQQEGDAPPLGLEESILIHYILFV